MNSLFWIVVSAIFLVLIIAATVSYLTRDMPTYAEKRQKKMLEELLEEKEKKQ